MDANNQSQHHIVQTLFGPVCTSCVSRVSANKSLFSCARNTIKKHWDKNRCSTGNPSPARVERELLERLRQLHIKSIGNEEIAFEHFKDGDEGVKRTLRHHCSHCGLVDERSSLLRHHCTSHAGRGKCPGQPVKAYVLTNKYKQLVPESFVRAIIANNSPLRRLKPNMILPTVAPIQTAVQVSPPAATSPSGAIVTCRTTMTSEPSSKRIKISERQMELATGPQLGIYPTDRQQHIDNQIMTLGAPDAADHAWFFQHACLKGENLKDALVKDATIQQSKFCSEKDDISMKALLTAADMWFTSQSANIDVKAISSHMRADLFKVGSKSDNDESDLIWGKTFVPTNDLEHVRKELKYLIQFLYRGKHIQENLLAALHDIQECSPYDDSNVERWFDGIARKILVTDLIPAIIINSVLEDPVEANGPTLFHGYIAARSTKIKPDNNLDMRQPNNISRAANALLRVVRHAVCTHLNHLSEDYKNDNNKWQKQAAEIIERVQTAPAIGHICLRITTSRYAQLKKPSTLNKMVEIETGDIYVAGATFHYERWSRSIQHAIALVEESLKAIFQNHDALAKWRDVRNHVVWNGRDDTCVRVTTDEVESTESIIPQQHLVPALGHQADDNKQRAIDCCFNFEKFSYAYMGVGAARGTEVVNIGDFGSMEFVFNTLKYDLLSRKGESHGRHTNTSVQHFLPPSISRIILLTNLLLWPAVEQSSVFTLPDKSTSHVAADKYFMKVFNLQQSIGCKNNRQAIASMLNLICPSKDSRLAVHPFVADKFQHTGDTHNKFYADNVILKEDGVIIEYPLLMAREVWRALGEETTPTAANSSSTNASSQRLSAEQYNYAAKTLYGPLSSTSALQLEAIRHLDDTSAQGQCHAFVFMAPGTGKSGLYNISAAAAAIYGRTIERTLVISPHNGLLAQHCQQATNYFKTLHISVASYESSDISEHNDEPPNLGDANLCFISISAFNKVRKYHRNTFQQWGFKRIIIDEYHNVLSEIFRFDSSWDGLRGIAALRTKVVCMSATANEFIMTCISRLLGLGTNYKVIGDINKYQAPNVAILLSTVTYSTLISTVVNEVYNDFSLHGLSNHTAHVITLSVNDAKVIEEQLNERGIKSKSLHSECTKVDRQDIMSMWSENKFQALVSTIQDGIDSSLCSRVYIAGGSHNNMALIQSIGRIRPRQQKGKDATVKIFDTDHPTIDQNYEEHQRIFTEKVIGAGLIGEEDRGTAASVLTDLFTRQGFKNYLTTTECLRQQLLTKIGVRSEICGMCSKCLHKNDIVRTATEAAAVAAENSRRKSEVLDCLMQMTGECIKCKRADCSGKECLEYSSCYQCHKSTRHCPRRVSCTLNRTALFQTATGNRQCILHLVLCPQRYRVSSCNGKSSSSQGRQG